MNTNKGKLTRERIIECAARLFIKNGYNNTGLNEILKELDLPKGSFYYQFKSKKELAIAVADYYKQDFGEWLMETAKNRDWTNFVEIFMNQIISNAKKSEYFGCPFGVLGSELAFLEPQLAESFLSPMNGLIHLFADILKFSGMPIDKIEEESNKALALFEGYILYYRVSKETSVLERLKKQLKEII